MAGRWQGLSKVRDPENLLIEERAAALAVRSTVTATMTGLKLLRAAFMETDGLPAIPANLPLEQWKSDWAIDRDILHCTECFASQFAHSSNHDFVHDLLCSRLGPNQRPWEDLVLFVIDPIYEWE